MSNSKKVIVTCIIWILFLVLILGVIPLSQSIMVKPNEVYYASERTITIDKETTDAEWSLSKIIEIDFTLSGLIYGYNMTPLFELELRASFEPWKITKIKYEFLCNGEVSRIIQEDLVGTSFNMIGSYPIEPLKSSLLRSGNNNLTLRISVVSTCEKPGLSSFKMIIKDLKVQNHLLDLDRDGIWDNVDSIPMNNYGSAIFLGIVSTPIIGYTALVLDRRFEKKNRVHKGH